MNDRSASTGLYRPAVIADAKKIQALIKTHAEKELMLHRSLNELYETIRHYTVCELDGELIAAAGLHIVWEDLAEVRAVTVAPEHAGKGIGRELVRRAIIEATRLGIPKIFTLTYVPEFFAKLGFVTVDKSEFPHKIWGDCVRCHKFPDCDETGMVYVIAA